MVPPGIVRGGDYGHDGPEIGVRNTQLGTGSSPDCRRGHGPWSHQGFIAKARLAVKGLRTDHSWFEPVLSLFPLRPGYTRPLAAESCPCLSLSRWPPPAPDLFMSNCRSISLSAVPTVPTVPTNLSPRASFLEAYHSGFPLPFSIHPHLSHHTHPGPVEASQVASRPQWSEPHLK